MIFAQLAATLRARGVTVNGHLQELYRRWVIPLYCRSHEFIHNPRYGYFEVRVYDILHPCVYHLMNSGKTSNSYFICTDPLVIEKIFSKIRSSGDMVSFIMD